ncbi:MAG: hypothetical protein Q8N68_02940, partial [bacterium]|nr:hypothetical protein [bacterium]
TCSNGNGVIDAVDHNGFLRIKVPREHPKGSVIDIFCLWKDGKYILGYWEILDLYFEAENLVEAVKIFCDLIDQFDYYQVIDVFCGEDRPQEMVN